MRLYVVRHSFILQFCATLVLLIFQEINDDDDDCDAFDLLIGHQLGHPTCEEYPTEAMYKLKKPADKILECINIFVNLLI